MQYIYLLLLLGSLVLSPAAIHAAPNPARLQLTISTPSLPTGSPFEVTLLVMEAPASMPVSLLAPEQVHWQVIPAGCQAGNPIICQPAPTWVGSFRGQIWDSPGTRLVFRAQMGDMTSSVTTELVGYQPPPTRELPVTATPLPVPTAPPTPLPTATPSPRPTAPLILLPTAPPIPPLPPRPTRPPLPSPTDVPPPAPVPRPTAAPAPSAPPHGGTTGAGGDVPPRSRAEPGTLDPAVSLPTTPPAPLVGITVEEIPLTEAAQPTAIPLMVVPLTMFACYDADQNKVCGVREGITGLTVYVMDGRVGTVLGQALTDSSGRASLTVRVSEQTELVISVPSFAATQRTSARAPTLKPILVGTVVPLPALLP